LPLAVPSAVAFLPEEVVCAPVRGLVFVTTYCQLRVSAYLGAVQLLTLYVTSRIADKARCSKKMKKPCSASIHPSPGPRAEPQAPAKPSPTPRPNSIQIQQSAAVTPIDCGVRCGVGSFVRQSTQAKFHVGEKAVFSWTLC